MSRNLTHAKTVLLVDDLDILRKMLRDFLESWGMKTLEASNAAEAIHTARSHLGPIDLLMTDVEMPGLTGWEAANEIAVLRPGIPILYMSAGITLQEWNENKEKMAGAYFIQKPFRREELKALLMTIVSK